MLFLIQICSMDSLGSDIVAIIVAVLTVAVGWYSSFKKEKDKKRKAYDRTYSNLSQENAEENVVRHEKRQPEYLHIEELDEDQDQEDELDDLFDFIFKGKEKKEEVPQIQKDPEPEPEPESVFVPEEAIPATLAYNNGFQENIENANALKEPHHHVEKMPVYNYDRADGGISDGKNHDYNNLTIKERLKISPRDMIVFSEILKPKFRDF